MFFSFALALFVKWLDQFPGLEIDEGKLTLSDYYDWYADIHNYNPGPNRSQLCAIGPNVPIYWAFILSPILHQVYWSSQLLSLSFTSQQAGTDVLWAPSPREQVWGKGILCIMEK